MSFKEWDAAIMVVSGLAVAIWVALGAASEPNLALAAVAVKLLIAVGVSVVLNIIAHIVIAIIAGIFQREHPRDEPADERDRAVDLRAMRNGYISCSLGALLSLVPLAMGAAPQAGAYSLFAALMAAGIIYAGSRFIYYRLG